VRRACDVAAHIEPCRLLAAAVRACGARTSCKAHAAVIIASRRCSGTGSPSAVLTASVCMCMPTLRASSTARPGSVTPSSVPSGERQLRGPLSVRRRTGSPRLAMSHDRPPVISPSQLRYARTLSSASTVHALSSRSQMVERADSTRTSTSPPRLQRTQRASVSREGAWSTGAWRQWERSDTTVRDVATYRSLSFGAKSNSICRPFRWSSTDRFAASAPPGPG
jgi:hypothetical protein